MDLYSTLFPDLSLLPSYRDTVGVLLYQYRKVLLYQYRKRITELKLEYGSKCTRSPRQYEETQYKCQGFLVLNVEAP